MSRALVALAFFVSGASSLMLEVVWSKALGRVLGTTLEAITTVVAAYMFGLALGAWCAGRSQRLAANPVRSYGLLEAGIGLFALVSLPLVAALDGPLGAAYRAFGGESAAFAMARFLAAFVLLLVPTTLMGATLPVLVAWGAKRADLVRVLGTLYAINTAGAVVGTLVAGFALLPAVGLSRTALVAGGASLAVGALMLLASRASRAPAAAPATERAAAKPAPAAAPATPSAADRSAARERARLMLVLFALSGLVSLSCQIAWSRLAATLIGSSVYSFTLVLATFLVGIALGSALLVVFLGTRAPSWRLVAVLQWIAAAGVVYASVRLADAPWQLLDTLATAQGDLSSLWAREALLLAGVMLPACLAFGALFPAATRLSALAGDAPARTAGRAYGWNTLGTVTGSLVTGFLLVQTVGTRSTLLGSAALALLLGIAAWVAAPGAGGKAAGNDGRATALRFAVPLAVAALFAVALGRLPSWDRGLFAMGVFRPSILAKAGAGPADARRSLLESMQDEEMVWLKEGRQATVTVHRLRSDSTIVALRVNGKTDASTGLDMATQVLSAQLPMLWAPKDAPRVLIVGYGSGVTVGSVLTHDPARADMAEIEPAVIEADRWFAQANHRPRENPRLVTHVEDGRTFLSKRLDRYDVIVSEPSNPWIAGVNNLFTEDFYRLVRSRLEGDGVFCQWIQFYELSSETLATLLRTVYAVFPEAEVFIANNDLLLVAPVGGAPLDLGRASERMARPAVASDLARVGVHGTADLLAYHRMSLRSLVELLPASPLNTDDRPVAEYRAPKDLYRVRAGESPLPEDVLGRDTAQADLARWTTNGAPSLLGEVDATRRRDESWALAQRALVAHNLEAARGFVDEVLAIAPDFAPALVERGRIAMQDGEIERAKTLFRQSIALGGPDERYEALCHLGMIELRTGRADAALAAFQDASRARPQIAGAYVFRARALAALGRGAEAMTALDEGARAATDRAAIERARDELRARESPR